MAPLSQSGKIDNHDVEERVRDSEQSHRDRITQGSMESGDDNEVKEFSSVPAIPRQAPVSLVDHPSILRKPERTKSVSSSLDSQSSNDELRPQHRPHTQYQDDPNQSANASNRTAKSHPFSSNTTRGPLRSPVFDRSLEPASRRLKERDRRSTRSIHEESLAIAAESSELTSRRDRVPDKLNQGFARPSGKPKPVSTQYNDDPIRGASRGDSQEQHSPARSDDPIPIGATVSKTSVVTELPTLNEKRTNGTQTTMNLLYHQQKIDSMTVSSKLILAVKSDNMIQLWDLLAGKDVFRITFKMTYRDTISRVTFSPDGTLLAAVRSEGPDDARHSTVSVWTSDIGVKLFKLDLQGDSISIAFAISEDNKWIACSQTDRRSHPDIITVEIYEITTGKRVGGLSKVERSVHMLAFMRNDRQLVCCSIGRVEIWDLTTYTLMQKWSFRRRSFRGAIVTPDRMLVCSDLTMIDLRSGVIEACVSGLVLVHHLAYARATKGIAFTRYPGSVGIWNSLTGCVVHLSPDDTQEFNRWPAVAIAPDGQAVFYGSVDGMVRVWYINN